MDDFKALRTEAEGLRAERDEATAAWAAVQTELMLAAATIRELEARLAAPIRTIATTAATAPQTPTASSVVYGEHKTCPACESLILPDGTCVNCRGRGHTGMCSWTPDTKL